MATQAMAGRRQTVARSAAGAKEAVFEWEGRDRNGRVMTGEMRAVGQA